MSQIVHWKPFATAPTDGTEILAYRPDMGVFTVVYHPTKDAQDEWDDDNCVWMTTDLGSDISDYLPTHWMPFPSPPANDEVEP